MENENICLKLTNLDIRKLTEEEKESIEGPIMEHEALNVLKNMKNDQSPGADGFTAEFLNFFWSDLKLFVIRAINKSYEIGELSSTNKLGIITCIPKEDKPKQFLKNWRPITLLTVVYKIATGCIAEQIKKFLDKLISNDQTGFVKKISD